MKKFGFPASLQVKVPAISILRLISFYSRANKSNQNDLTARNKFNLCLHRFLAFTTEICSIGSWSKMKSLWHLFWASLDRQVFFATKNLIYVGKLTC